MQSKVKKILSSNVLKDLPSELRKKSEQLLTEMVHQRDVTRLIVSNNVNNKAQQLIQGNNSTDNNNEAQISRLTEDLKNMEKTDVRINQHTRKFEHDKKIIESAIAKLKARIAMRKEAKQETFNKNYEYLNKILANKDNDQRNELHNASNPLEDNLRLGFIAIKSNPKLNTTLNDPKFINLVNQLSSQLIISKLSKNNIPDMTNEKKTNIYIYLEFYIIFQLT